MELCVFPKQVCSSDKNMSGAVELVVLVVAKQLERDACETHIHGLNEGHSFLLRFCLRSSFLAKYSKQPK